MIQDSGVLFESQEEQIDYGYNSREEQIIPRPFNPDYTSESFRNEMHIVYFYSENSLKFYTRKYLKFPDVLANVNGFMSLLIFLVKFFYSFYNKFRLDLLTYRKLIKMDFDIENKMRLNSYMNNLNEQIGNNGVSKNPPNKIYGDSVYYEKVSIPQKEFNLQDINLNHMKINNTKNNEKDLSESHNADVININNNNILNKQNVNNKSDIMLDKMMKNDNFNCDLHNQLNNNSSILVDSNRKMLSNSHVNESSYLENNEKYDKSKYLAKENLGENNNNQQINNIQNRLANNLNKKDGIMNNTSFNKNYRNVKWDISKGNYNEEGITHIFQTYQEKKNFDILKFWDKLRDLACSRKYLNSVKTNKLVLLDKCSEKFNAKFNIFYYFRKLKNINLLKKLLFDKDEFFMINFISRKYCSEESLLKFVTDFENTDNQKNIYQNKLEFLNSCNNIYLKYTNNWIDKKDSVSDEKNIYIEKLLKELTY